MIILKKSRLVALSIACFISSFSGLSQEEIGGGNLNPGLVTNKASIERFQDLRFGLSIHWGPSSLGGKEISWSRDKEIDKNTYDNYYKSFNPTKFDAQEWMELVKDSGMKYIVLTSKHHDGFSLWHSKYTDYDIANTPFKRDIVRELSDAAKANGIMFGSYYSILDWYHPDYQPYNHGGPGKLFATLDDTPNFERYLIFMKNQLEELVRGYGAEIIQLDGEWDPTWNHQLGSDLYLFLRMLNDKTIVNSRTDVGRYHLDPKTKMWDWSIYSGDFDERERMVDWVQEEDQEYTKTESPWQAWVTIDQAQWSWNETPRSLTSNEIIVDLLETIGDNGNYLINVGPQPDGSFHKDQIATMKRVGNWVKQYSDGIYETRGGPFVEQGKYTSTINAKTVYLYLFDDSLKSIDINLNDLEIRSVSDYQGNNIKYTAANGMLTIDLSTPHKEVVRVFKLRIN